MNNASAILFIGHGRKIEVLTGACNHALGYYKEAIIDYTRAFSQQGSDELGEDSRQQQVCNLKAQIEIHEFNVFQFHLSLFVHLAYRFQDTLLRAALCTCHEGNFN